MPAWVQKRFSNPHTGFATIMAIAGSTGVLCCIGIIGIVLAHR